MQLKTFIQAVVLFLEAGLLMLSAAILFTIFGFSVMIFDAGESVQAWSVFLGINSILLVIASISLYTTVHYFRKRRYLLSLLGSAGPVIAFLLFQIILNITL
ncbi:MAG: hypothetical protein O3A81_02765 [bacterium]|nr:hypothetical protein [bacterium]